MENEFNKKSVANSKVHGEINAILKEYARKRVNGKVASDRTTTSYGEVLHKCFDDLHGIGYKIENPRNFSGLHVQALCRKWYDEGKKQSTMQEYLSKLRVFAGWIGKRDMVRSLPTYLPDVPKSDLKVLTVAMRSKSWTENGINVAAKILLADEIDERFGCMVRMALAFGLRRTEVLHMRPWKSDLGDKLVIYPGEAKGGGPRIIYINTPEQRAVLDCVKLKFNKDERMGWSTDPSGKVASYEFNLGRFNRCAAKIGITKKKAGVTFHGLRAQYAENAALIMNLLPPTLGGTGGQMDKSDLDVKREQIAELLGHGRVSATGAYYGSFGRRVLMDPVDKRKENIERALRHCEPGVVMPVLPEHREDCQPILLEMAKIGVEITMGQAELLWLIHSQRHAMEWVKPERGIAEAMEAAAIRLYNQLESREGPSVAEAA